ncbi:SWIM zinc finger family protein [Halorarum halophilum]|uniref:SWIM zinc finger family protein n=1 Tax=Halorarum halophilum TaxID=2743090 RepID=A0A7D5KED7_9EURY|nr:SWIM zinc finger family protein [Halobaculum halophilum]QLG28177.1 SWIM zinc finger family protein [Halobaculum halophilum]
MDVFSVTFALDEPEQESEAHCNCDYDGDSEEDPCRHIKAAAGAFKLALEGGEAQIHRSQRDALRRERVRFVDGPDPMTKDDWLDATDGRLTVGGMDSVV